MFDVRTYVAVNIVIAATEKLTLVQINELKREG